MREELTRSTQELDPSTIEEEDLRQKFVDLMNVVAKQQSTIAEQAAEIQRLRDEINRLKGEQGKPKIAANKAALDLSSEKERRQSKPHHKSSKQAKIPIDRQVVLKVDPEQLPADAVFKGYQDVVVQDIEIRTDNVQFRKETYYRSEEHTSELQSRLHLVCRLLLEKKKS